jgi:hypothetical protein
MARRIAAVMRTPKEMAMEAPVHNLSQLFAQLGQPDNEAAIASFIDSHCPLPDHLMLHEAPFWTPSQAAFLREAIVDDADWAEAADELNAELRAPH